MDALLMPRFLRSAGLAYGCIALGLGGGFAGGFVNEWVGGSDLLFISYGVAGFKALACVALIVAVIAVQSYPRAARSKTMRVGAILWICGMLGLAVHACMTALPGNPFPRPMAAFPLFFWALIVVFMVGCTTYSAGFYHIDATSPWAKRIFIVSLVWGVFGRLGCHYAETAPYLVNGGFLGFVILGLLWQGTEIFFRFRYKNP